MSKMVVSSEKLVKKNIAGLMTFMLVGSLWMLGSGVAQAAPATWSMGYYTPWGNPSLPISAIYWPSLTHISHVGAQPLSDGTLDLTSENVTGTASSLVLAAHGNNIKVLLNIWSGPNSDFKGAINNNLTTFLDNIMNTVYTYGYDGVDLDWEGGLDYSSMTTLVSNLRSRLGTKLLTVAAGVTDYVYWGTVTNYLDRVSVMTYDLTGNWNVYIWHDSALYGPASNDVWSLDLARSRFTAAGVPAAKINLGIPFFGYVVSGGCQIRQQSTCTDGLYAPYQNWVAAPTFAQTNYHVLVANYNLTSSNPAWRWDATAHEPYLSINNAGAGNDQFVTFEDPQSLTDKVNYIKSNNLGGWIIWALDQDYFPNGTTIAQKYPLSNAIALAMSSTSDPPPSSPGILRIR